MFKNVISAVILSLLINAAAFAAEAGYSSVIEDLPLMPGMVEKTDDALVFDKPGGRIVETSAEISASAAEVERFYGQALPSLGWKAVTASRFTREDETLKLNAEKQGNKTLVHFNLNPASEGK